MCQIMPLTNHGAKNIPSLVIFTSKCRDSRCLFRSPDQQPPSAASFETVTSETREGPGIWEKCRNCSLVINRSGVPPEEAMEFYNEDYVKKNSYSKGEVLTAKAHFEARLPSVRRIAERLKPLLQKSQDIFELGAASGELLHLIQPNVHSCFGMELNSLFCEFMRTELSIPATDEDFMGYSFPQQYDGVISVNTVDHMYETGRVLEKLFSILKPGGWLYIEVPNDEQALRTELPLESRSGFTKFMYQKAHYYSFSFETLGALLKQCGFEVLDRRSEHDYTLKNFLQWYYLGRPQKKFDQATSDDRLFGSNTSFGTTMDRLFTRWNQEFLETIKDNGKGELISILAKRPL